MFEAITMYTLDGTDYFELMNGEVLIHRLEHDEAIIEVPDHNLPISHWLLEEK